MSMWRKEFMKWSRTLHIYISLVGFSLFLFFAATGIQLTHESFGMDEAKAADSQISIDASIAAAANREEVLAALNLPLTISGPGMRN
jgi:hypothetical protein